MKYLRTLPLVATLAIACGSTTAETTSQSGSSGTGGSGSTASGEGATSSSGAGTGGSLSSSSGHGGSSEGGASSASGGSSSSSGGASACSGLANGPGSYDETLMFGGLTRTFHVHAPAGYDPTKPTMLMLLFHGWLETSASGEEVTKMTPVSDTHGFLVVYPQGTDDSWNAGTCCGTAPTESIDDVGFVKALLDKLATEYCVDPARVFATGFSNGGMLSHRLGCEASDRFAAIGSVSGTIAVPTCTPTRPVPVLHVHGKDDPIVPWDGGALSDAQSVPDTISGWVMRDGCTDAQPANVYTKGDASCASYTACKAGSAVELCTISDGGHQWPGGDPAGGIGTSTNDLDASETFYQFFAAHPMP